MTFHFIVKSYALLLKTTKVSSRLGSVSRWPHSADDAAAAAHPPPCAAASWANEPPYILTVVRVTQVLRNRRLRPPALVRTSLMTPSQIGNDGRSRN